MGGGHGMGWWSRYQLEADDAADRRNGYYQRHLLTELGDIELNVPRTRRYSPVEVIRAYARRTPEIDRVILSAFVLWLSTRKVGETLLRSWADRSAPRR
jgi:transposase-like protein